MKTYIALSSPEPKDYVFMGSYMQVEFPQENARISFFVNLVPIGKDTIFYGAAWGGLFQSIAVVLKEHPEMAELFSELWPLTVKYILRLFAREYKEGVLMYFNPGVLPGEPDAFWMLGYEVADVKTEYLSHLSLFSLDHVMKVSEMSLELMLELTDEDRVQRFATQHGLLERRTPHAMLEMFGKIKVFHDTFGVRYEDFGEDEGENLDRFGLWKPL